MISVWDVCFGILKGSGQFIIYLKCLFYFFFLHYRSQNKGIRTVRSSHDALKGARKIKNYSYLIYKNGDNNCTILIGGCEDYILGTIYVASTV